MEELIESLPRLYARGFNPALALGSRRWPELYEESTERLMAVTPTIVATPTATPIGVWRWVVVV